MYSITVHIVRLPVKMPCHTTWRTTVVNRGFEGGFVVALGEVGKGGRSRERCWSAEFTMTCLATQRAEATAILGSWCVAEATESCQVLLTYARPLPSCKGAAVPAVRFVAKQSEHGRSPRGAPLTRALAQRLDKTLRLPVPPRRHS